MVERMSIATHRELTKRIVESCFSEEVGDHIWDAQRVRADMVVSRLCWLMAHAFSRRRVLMQSALSRKASAEGDDGRETIRREWTDEKTLSEMSTSSGVSGSVILCK